MIAPLEAFLTAVYELRWVLALLVITVLSFLWLQASHHLREADRDADLAWKQADELADEADELRADKKALIRQVRLLTVAAQGRSPEVVTRRRLSDPPHLIVLPARETGGKS